jgi:hypothetical protein
MCADSTPTIEGSFLGRQLPLRMGLPNAPVKRCDTRYASIPTRRSTTTKAP